MGTTKTSQAVKLTRLRGTWALPIMGLCLMLGGPTLRINAQDFGMDQAGTFLEFVDPIILQGEIDIYNSLKSYDEKDYFEAIFWFKRDPHPDESGNQYKKAYFERRQQAQMRFREGSVPGTETERGRIFLLLGEPDNVTQKRIEREAYFAGFEETWAYRDPDVTFRFILDADSNHYRLESQPGHALILERVKQSQIHDRAESYRMNKTTLALPNVGFTKDIENLTLDDRFEIDFTRSYSFFRGDRDRTSVYVGLTFHDASDKGLEVNLTAYDPYDNKVVDFKKKFEAVNEQMTGFFVVLEPDQYQMVLRIQDRDGREAVDRTHIDVPRIGQRTPAASSIILSSGFEPIPTEGFTLPDTFLCEERFVPPVNSFRRFGERRMTLMQHYYNLAEPPKLRFGLDGAPIDGRIERLREIQPGDYQLVASFPLPSDPGDHEIKILRAASPTLWEASTARFWLGQPVGETDCQLLRRSKPTDEITWLAPLRERIENFNAVAVRLAEGLDATHMFVLINSTLFWEKDEAPWRIEVSQDRFSITGNNTLTVVMQTNRGLLRISKDLQPLRADESIMTRAVQVFFNAYKEDLNFVSELDTNDLRVEVDGKPWNILDVYHLDEPITFCFLIDTSFSMRESLKGNLRAVKKIISAMRGIDKGYFVDFSDNYYQLNQPTTSKGVLQAVADSVKLQRPNPKYADRLYQENQTYIYDAVIAAVHTLLQYPGRKVIILVSDGIGSEGIFSRNAMLSYARENEVVIYSLWLDNNPQLSDEETEFLQRDMKGGERFFRAIGFSRFFAKKDARKNLIGRKIRNASISEGALKILAEESGGFHYRVFKADRSLIEDYMTDIENAVATQYVMILNLPVSEKMQHVEISSDSQDLSFRVKSEVKVRKTNPLSE